MASSSGLLLALVVLLGACSSPESPSEQSSAPMTDAPSEAAPPATPPATPPQPFTETPTVRVTAAQDLLTGLDAPWGLAFLRDGGALITLRDEARVVLLRPDGEAADVGGPGAQELAATTTPRGEGGLLGVAVAPQAGTEPAATEQAGTEPAATEQAGTEQAATEPADATATSEIYLYRTAADGNEVVRATLDGTTLSALDPVLEGIPKASNHDGGRLAFGPDGFLYVSTGDAGDPSAAQDPDSLAGKILRLTPDGEPAPGNPTPGSPVWTLGHRNVQGIGWAPDGRMFASEFGQNTFDELNQIIAGANYGWPEVEGTGGGGDGFAEPLATWSTSQASPSGLAVTAEGVYLAALRGERLWRVPLTADGVGQPQELLTREYGRLRAVTVAPDGSLWILTNNTDGRGDPRRGDDRLVRISVD